MKRVIEMAFALLLIAGAFEIGRRIERKWWRTEIAAQSSRVSAAVKKLDQDAAEFDSVLVKLIGDADAKLDQAEAAVSALESKPPAGSPDDPCKPVPAHCLRRPGPSGSPASHAAAGR